MKGIFVITLALCLGACASQPAQTVATDQPAVQSIDQTQASNDTNARRSNRVYLDHAALTPLADVARQAFAAVGARGWGRVDFMTGADKQPLVLEVNTVPGMTSHSLVPMAAKAVGISFEQLVWKILEQTLGD